MTRGWPGSNSQECRYIRYEPRRAIEKGEIQRAIQESAYRQQQQTESGERLVVGVNAFRTEADDAAAPAILRIDPSFERAQVERVRALRARRDPAAWQHALGAVEDRARTGGPLMPLLVEAVLAHATVGEIAGRLRAVWGEHREVLVV